MNLYDKMLLFGQVLNIKQKEHLLLAALYNDLRLYEDNPEIRFLVMKKFLDSENNSLITKFNKTKLSLSVSRETWVNNILEANWQLSKIPGTKPLERSFMLNIWLSRQGLCPLIHFAFDNWYELNPPWETFTSNILQNLVDLSTTFLYRLISVEESLSTNCKIGTGAYSNVYKSEDDKYIYKVPRNLAAFSFAAHEEYIASLYASSSALAPYIPKLISYNQELACIQREFIEGTSGFDLLGDNNFLGNPDGLDQIKNIYTIACSIYKEDNINFDIHPGNLLWSNQVQQWFLVDLGPMPEIGADYFPRDRFEDYFQKIWLDLYELMVTVPIRSLDILLNDQYILELPNNLLDWCL